MFYKTILSNHKRDHVINYIKQQKILNSDFKVIDIGASAHYTNWSYEVIDYVIDFNHFQNDSVKQFNFNINYESQWSEVLKYVEDHGKFDFCICSHTLEDIAMPSVVLSVMPLIAKEGFIATPSKFAEFSRIGNQPWLGYIHHRWIFTFKDGTYILLPKLNFIEFIPELAKMQSSSQNMHDLSFFWKDEIKFKIINDDYLGPTVPDVISYYSILLNDDLISDESRQII